MSSLKIRYYSTDESSSEGELKGTATVPLNVMGIMAKHIPDQILRLIYDNENPNSGSAAINVRTIVQTINEILQEIESKRRVGELNGVIAEFALEPEEVAMSEKRMEGIRVVFSVEGQEIVKPRPG